MTYADIKNKMKTLGFSDEEFFKMWLEVYVLSSKKEDLHSNFAEKLGCTRDEAKGVHWALMYKSPYLQDLLRLTRICSLESAKAMVGRSKDLKEVDQRLMGSLDHLESLHDKYIENFREIKVVN
ncbi:hypothetical protein LAh9_79 [Aeromonas phage LAh_9]|uniref:Uncharacterized protein n=3 Tax=Lahexavirus TaxID=2843411 RepID=A0A514A0Y1_9CAUD|nr:hypothetical protein HWC29_gp004 [Aeromonas phage 4_4572]YP_009847472.1 hypothetical protein HWC31_gp134 [Aeromonas phage LAh_8]YP_009847560.1 hypothetical protein HWC32_gp079 [Aeromonas phage LAh_9]QDH46795.1 hypothetical protein LAh8_133 [Aeromonas phage LAh_8]QDH46939.1 hypothetical protein LAh9_79 [Aeromonas phage LAh_9]QEG09002.1 hypothetical protein [Aeromonas phage 4_4572]